MKEVLKMLGDTHAYRGSSRHALAALTRNLVVGDLALPMGHRMSFMNRVIVVLWSVFLSGHYLNIMFPESRSKNVPGWYVPLG